MSGGGTIERGDQVQGRARWKKERDRRGSKLGEGLTRDKINVGGLGMHHMTPIVQLGHLQLEVQLCTLKPMRPARQ